jgi:hypothetical protein
MVALDNNFLLPLTFLYRGAKDQCEDLPISHIRHQDSKLIRNTP